MMRKKGFTLLEVIVIITIVAILGALVVKMLNRDVVKSPEQIGWTQAESDIEKSMEAIIADYVALMNDDATRDNALSTLQTRNGSNAYGAGVVMTSTGFSRSGGAETGSGSLLKVTITRNRHSLTTILSPSRTDAADGQINY